MKKTVLLYLTVFIVISSSSNIMGNQYRDKPQQIIVAGKVDNYDHNLQVIVTVKRIGLTQDDITAKIDSAGNFIATFESYIPLDVVIGYKTNFWVLLHPGDSIFVQFDGKHRNRPGLLETVYFSGDAAQTNRYAAKFQQMYFSNEIYYDWDKINKAVKEYDPAQYLQYLDTLRQKGKEIFDKFVAENQPDNESKRWAQIYIGSDYYNYLCWYASDHREANNMKEFWDVHATEEDAWDVPKGFYDPVLHLLPIEPSMFMSAYVLSGYPGHFSRYIFGDKLKGRKTDSTWAVLPGGRYMGQKESIDSVKIFSSIEFIPDPLMRQISLTYIFDRDFNKQRISVYERFREVADTHIKEPFLKEPLYQKYLQTKSRIENPQVYTKAILKEVADFSIKQIVDDIFQQNKGKVIYIDFWGTWCGPCLGELPNSKVIEHELKDKDVAFVYVCLESEEKKWKATLDKFQLGGQQYLLSNKQSREMRDLFEINGVPFYMLIDKNGVIQEKGSHLRPLSVKNKINELLK